MPDDVNIKPANVKAGDKVIINGTITGYGIAIMSVRENLEFETEIRSNTAAFFILLSHSILLSLYGILVGVSFL